MPSRETVIGHSRQPGKEPSRPRPPLQVREWAGKLMALSGIVAAAVVIYLVYGAAIGAFGKYPLLPAAEQARYGFNIWWATQILWYAVAALILGLAVWQYEDLQFAYLLAFLGILGFFGIPFAISLMQDPRIGLANGLLQMMARELRDVAGLAICEGMALAGIDAIRRLREGLHKRQEALEKRRQAAIEAGQIPLEDRKEGFLPGKCWQLPYCRPYLLNACQAYQRRKPCWRVKSGCMCDPEMLVRLLDTTSGSRKKDLNWLVSATRQGARGGKPDCKSCVIYDVHQKQKYRLISPLALPIAIGLAALALPFVHQGYVAALYAMDRFIRQIAFSNDPLSKSRWLELSLNNSVIEWMLIISLGLWLANAVVYLIDFVIFKLKW